MDPNVSQKDNMMRFVAFLVTEDDEVLSGYQLGQFSVN
jgi:hypothetical protein